MNKLLTKIYNNSFVENELDPDLFSKNIITECCKVIKQSNIDPFENDEERMESRYWKGYIHASDDAIVELQTQFLTDMWEENDEEGC